MATRNYTQMNDVSHAHAQAYHVLNTLDYNNKKPTEEFEQQVKMEFEENNSNNQQYNQEVGFQENISQSLPDIRTSYFQQTQQNACSSDFQRTKSLSHSPSAIDSDSGSSDCGDSPKPKSSFSKKDSSRPRMYKFNPKPLTLNPSMKRTQTPTDNKDNEYWEKRKKNNEASRRSRLARRLKECMVMEEMKKLKKENEELKAELSKMQNAAVCRM